MRLRRACTIGAISATVPFVIALLGGHRSLLQRTWRGNFYDLQAHSLLRLRWDVPRGSLSNEAFVVHGKTYMYFGPLPALLRLPIAAITHSLDGRLSQLSMLFAWVIVLVAIVRLAWQVRVVVAGERPADRAELWTVGGFVALFGFGTPILYLATRPMVYTEALMWGLALALLALSAVIEFSVTRSRSQLLLATACASGALLSRATLGLTAVFAIGLLAIAAAVPQPWRGRLQLNDLALARADTKHLAASSVLAVVPYVYVNFAKFGSLVSIPYSKHLYIENDPVRLHNLEAAGGSLFGLQFIPTTFRQYFRPDAISLHWPLPTFGHLAKPMFGVKLDGLEATSSVVDTMLVMSLLAVVGCVWFLQRSDEGPSKHILVIPLTAAALGSVVTLSFSYIAQRYLIDFVPVMLLSSLIGLNVGIHWFRLSSHTLRQVAFVGIIAVVAANVWVSIGLAKISDDVRHAHDEVCASINIVHDCNWHRPPNWYR